MNSLEYSRTLLRGIIIGFGGSVFLYMAINMITTVFDIHHYPSKLEATQSNFKVVDTYKGKCDIIRYTPPNGGLYQYLMDCRK